MGLILQSISADEINVGAKDRIEIFAKSGLNKRGAWSVPETVLSLNKKGKTVTVPGKGGKQAMAGLTNIQV